MGEKKEFSSMSFIIIIVSVCLAEMILMMDGKEKGMDWSQVIAIIVAVLGLIGTIVAQLIQNKRETKDLKAQIKSVSEDVGRADRSSLTRQHEELKETMKEQHKDIKSSISSDFKIIQDRYQKEDNAYYAFTKEQRSLKEALDGFSKDYSNVIQQNQSLNQKNAELRKQLEVAEWDKQKLKEDLEAKYKEQITALQAENEALKKENETLQGQQSQGGSNHIKL